MSWNLQHHPVPKFQITIPPPKNVYRWVPMRPIVFTVGGSGLNTYTTFSETGWKFEASLNVLDPHSKAEDQWDTVSLRRFKVPKATKCMGGYRTMFGDSQLGEVVRGPAVLGIGEGSESRLTIYEKRKERKLFITSSENYGLYS